MGLFKKNKDKKKKPGIFKKIGAAVKGAVTKVKAVGSTVKNKATEVAMLALFIPFRGVAEKFLTRRGIKPSTDLKGLVLQVRNEMGKSSFAYVPGGDVFSFGYSQPGELGYFGYSSEELGYGLVPGAPVPTPSPTPSSVMSEKFSEVMVKAVIEFLKTMYDTIKKKSATGQPLSADEKEIADQAAQIDAAIKQAQAQAQNIVEHDGDSFSFDWRHAVGLLLLLAVVLFFVFRKR